MIDKIISKLKEKKLYEAAIGVGAFLLILIIDRVFTISVALLPAIIFFVLRFILKAKLKGIGRQMVNALAIQIAHYLIILVAALQNPLVAIIDIFIIFWGTYWLYKKPSWKSGGLMIGYNAYRLIFAYLPGARQTLPEDNITNLRSAAFAITLALLSILFIIAAVREAKAERLMEASTEGTDTDTDNVEEG